MRAKNSLQKRNFRKRLLHQSSEDRHEKDKKILCNLEDLKEFKDAGKSSFYAPIHGEVDTFEIIKGGRTKRNFLPKTNKRRAQTGDSQNRQPRKFKGRVWDNRTT